MSVLHRYWSYRLQNSRTNDGGKSPLWYWYSFLQLRNPQYYSTIHTNLRFIYIHLTFNYTFFIFTFVLGIKTCFYYFCTRIWLYFAKLKCVCCNYTLMRWRMRYVLRASPSIDDVNFPHIVFNLSLFVFFFINDI